jgi:FMN phosphatase YigB (HAD superfamily)
MKIFIFDLDDTIIYYPFGIVDYRNIRVDINLSRILNNLNSPKYIYSNGTYGHVKEILNKMNLTNSFDKLYARDTIPYMKPYVESYKFIEQDIRKKYNDRNKYYFFDDRLENLQTAKSRGWNTIWININFIDKPYYVDYAFPNIHTAAMYFLLEN